VPRGSTDGDVPGIGRPRDPAARTGGQPADVRLAGTRHCPPRDRVRRSPTISASATQSGLGAAFAEAFAAKDFARIAELVHPEVDFRGLTPRRVWEASSPSQLVEEILRQWLEDSDVVEELVAVESDVVADTERVGYRLRGHNDDGPFVVEQQAYLRERDGRIGWMRVVCSGFRPPG
jgi:hypothetical protein